MRFRKFGELNWETSLLGFGCMRLPITGASDQQEINESEATQMLHYAIDQGVNYLDTAYTYHNGNSERFLGRALQGGYRQRVYLATKLPCWLVNTSEDFDKYLNEQLEKLHTDYLDFYLFHSLNQDSWAKILSLNILKQAEKALVDGRIRHLGFSFHDSYDVFKDIVDGYDGWSFCQIQYNYMDVEIQAGTKGLQYAAAKGLAVVIMEGIRGGQLVNPPPEVQQLWDSSERKRAPADWALQWLWNQPEVTLVLSGMSTMEQVIQNIASADLANVNTLSTEELALVDHVRMKYTELVQIPCTDCKYCLPCPNGVQIPRNFAIYNEGAMYNVLERSRGAYSQWLSEKERASACLECLECEEKCPQHIPISTWMPIVQGVLGEGQPYGEKP